MSIIKTFLVDNGGMTYIKHGSDNFSLIDCSLGDRADELLSELGEVSKEKAIKRFISTHPDEDHIGGLNKIDDNDKVINFYCVKNNVKKSVETESFKRYKELRDGEGAFYIEQGISRYWMNQGDDARGGAGINILWPKTSDIFFRKHSIKRTWMKVMQIIFLQSCHTRCRRALKLCGWVTWKRNLWKIFRTKSSGLK